jgi:hypothetical protein
VTFSTELSGWVITETHVYLGSEPPEKSAPGRFTMQHSGISTDTDIYSREDVLSYVALDNCLYVAVHAVVEKDCEEIVDLEAFSYVIQEINSSEGLQVTAKYPSQLGYWTVSLKNSAGEILVDDQPGWCVDKQTSMSPATYNAEIFSSYDELPEYIKDRLNPEQLDMVNYILNQEWQCSAAEIQDAIWAVLGQKRPADISNCANAIYNAADSFGAGYVPPCGGVVGVIVAPQTGENQFGQILIGQILAAEIEVNECTTNYETCTEETAWGLADYFDNDEQNSCEFPKATGWGTYFQCCPTDLQ